LIHLLLIKNPIWFTGSVLRMYDTLKQFDHKFYTGMTIGGTHLWDYKNGKWWEMKTAPDQWSIQFNCVKTRAHAAPANTGAKLNTKFHWLILADQIATKIDANAYQTTLRGIKFKVGHQRPHWKTFSYRYPGQVSYKARVIQLLEDIIMRLKSDYCEFSESSENLEKVNHPRQTQLVDLIFNRFPGKL